MNVSGHHLLTNGRAWGESTEDLKEAQSQSMGVEGFPVGHRLAIDLQVALGIVHVKPANASVNEKPSYICYV